jgi:hypothetical protein
MKEQFEAHKFSDASQALIDQCNTIITRYLGQGLRLTLRQLYYQLVTRNLIPNVERRYKGLSKLLTNARLAGQVDWAAIEDRLRQPNLPNEFKNLQELVAAALASYRLPRWDEQPNYVELWVEKDALAGVLAPLGREYHVPIMVGRGYISISALYEAAARFRAHADKSCFLVYLGDHDPSGEDMVRDIRDRLRTLNCEVEVSKLALTMAQVRQYNPPPNPAKVSDSRAAVYMAQHGGNSWEVDALPPELLQQLIRERLGALRDDELHAEVLEREEADKTRLQAALDGLGD